MSFKYSIEQLRERLTEEAAYRASDQQGIDNCRTKIAELEARIAASHEREAEDRRVIELLERAP